MHHRYRPGDYETWKYVAPIQRRVGQSRSFEFGTWGGEFRAEFVPAPGESVVQEHRCSSGFANTDLDLQLRKRGIHKLIIIGLIAHTCIEATVRYAAELGYEVTAVKDATSNSNVRPNVRQHVLACWNENGEVDEASFDSIISP